MNLERLMILLVSFMIFIPKPVFAQKADEHYRRGVDYSQKGKLNKAIKEFKEVLEIQPNHYGTHYNLGNIYFHKRMLREAIREYKKAITISPNNPEVHFNLAITYSLHNKINKAIEELNKVVEIAPWDAEAHYQLSKAYLVRRDPEKARKHLILAIQKGKKVPSNLLPAIEKMSRKRGKGS